MKKLIIALILLLPVGVWGQVQIDTVTAANAGNHVKESTNSYQESREATIGKSYSTSSVGSAQRYEVTPKWSSWRGCVFFDVSSLGLSSVDSAKIVMYGEASTIGTAFTVTGYSYYGDNTTAGYDDFDGWQSGVTDYNGEKLTNDFASGDFNDNSYDNVFTLTNAAIDTLTAHLADDFNVIFLMSRDISGDAEPEFELNYLGWEGTADTYFPMLIIYSTAPPAVTNFTINDSTSTTFDWAVDTTLAGTALEGIDIVLAADSSLLQRFTGNDTSGTVTGLSSLTEYIVKAMGFFLSGGTQIDTVQATTDGKILSRGNNYENQRTPATATDQHVHNDLAVGQNWDSSDYTVWRSLFTFATNTVSPLENIDSAKIYLNHFSDNLDTDFWYSLFAAYNDSVNENQWAMFDGWEAGTAQYGGVFMTDSLSTENLIVGWNIFTLTSAGEDSLVVHLSDSMSYVLISHEDRNYSAPTDQEYIRFDASEDAGEEPFMIIYSSGEADTAYSNADTVWTLAGGATVTNARGNIIHEARGHETKGLDDLRKVGRKIINYVLRKIGG